MRAQLRRELIAKDRGTIGPGVHDLKSVRSITWKDATTFAPEEPTWEGDVRYVEILIKQLGLSTRSSSQ